VLNGLVERDGFARADDFTEIAFSGAAPTGEIVRMRITGVAGGQLTGEVVA
jgi:threonylcarbamoyladenosine tRNA methylthiotransferase MtaB